MHANTGRQQQNTAEPSVQLSETDLSKLRKHGLSEVRMALEPANALEANVAACQTFATIGDYLLVSREGCIEVYGRDGKRLALDSDGCQLGVTKGQVAEVLAEAQYEPGRAVELLCVPAGWAQYAKSALAAYRDESSPRPTLDPDKLPAGEHKQIIPYFTAPTAISPSEDGSHVIFEAGGSLFPYRVAGKEGEILAPSEWKRLSPVEREKIGEEDIRKLPVLAKYLPSGGGAAIPGTPLLAKVSEGALVVTDSKRGLCVFTDQASILLRDPRDSQNLAYVRPDSNELVTTSAKSLSRGQNDLEVSRLPVNGTVTSAAFEPFGSYLLVTTKSGEDCRLLAIDRESLEVVAEIGGVKAPISLDSHGTIHAMGPYGMLRRIATNFEYLATGGLAELEDARMAGLRDLEELVSTIDLPDPAAKAGSPEASADPRDEKAVLRRIAETMDRRFGPKVDAADTVEGLDTLERQIGELKRRQDLVAHPEIFAPLEERIGERRTSFKVNALADRLDRLGESLEAAQAEDFDVKAALDELSLLRSERRSITIASRSVRETVDSRLRDVEASLENRLGEWSGQIVRAIEERFEGIGKSIRSASTPAELELVRAEPDVKDFERLVDALPQREIGREWKERLREALDSQKGEIEAARREAERREAEILAEKVEDSRGLLAEVKESLARVRNADQLKSWAGTNAVVLRYKESLDALPAEIRETEQAAFEREVADRERELRQGRFKREVRKGEIVLGTQSFPVFPGYSMISQPKVVPSYPGSPKGTLVYKAGNGKLYDTRINDLPINPDASETKEAIERTRGAAAAYFNSKPREIPKYQDFWTINAPVEGQLDQMAMLFKIMQSIGKGILIQEGDAGVGKNVLFEIFAHLTNRELFTFSCNRQTEKEDLTYAYMYDKERGTYRLPARLIEAIQTPGAIVLFDEINTLPVGVSKLLNAPLDHRRTLYMPFDDDIRIEPSVLFAGAMNPRHYLGTADLPQELVTRGVFMNVDYPPHMKGGKYLPYEAEMVAKYVEPLRGMKQADFYKAWNQVVNGEVSPGVDRILTRERERSIRDLQVLTKTANKVREAYRAFRSGASNDEINFVFSIRESEWVAAQLNFGRDIRTAIKDVVLAKARDESERSKLDAIISNV